jgi:hypothetical protein
VITRIWPLAIAGGLVVVVLVNVSFAWVATHTQPVIEASYTHATER